MQRQAIIAVYHATLDAERAREDLLTAGLPASDIQIGSAENDPRPADLTPTAEDVRPRSGGFLSWLFGDDVPEDDAARYHAHVYDAGKTIVSVRPSTELAVDHIIDILERHNPIDLEDETDGGGIIGSGAATGAGMATGTAAPSAAPLSTDAPQSTAPLSPAPTETTAPGAARDQRSSEEVIPTAREELQVGKREVAGSKRIRVRSYVTTRPVEEQVSLREETVVVERRKPSGSTGEGAFQEKEIEVTERREEPVVGKVVRPGEEVVVRKDVKDRVATVRDTVRETKVDVDRAAAGDKPAGMTAGPAGSSASSRPADTDIARTPETTPPVPGKPVP